MTRIVDLQKKYPTIPLEVIVKWDVQNRGIRDTEALYTMMAGKWSTRAALSYQSHTHGMTMKELAEKWSDKLRPGESSDLHDFYMKNGMACRLERDSESSYELRDLGDAKFALFDGEEKVDLDLYFPEHPSLWEKEEPVTSKGTRVSSLVTCPRGLSPHCFKMSPMMYCEFFATGTQCKFCNWNASQDDARSIGIHNPATTNLDEVVEAYKILNSRTELLEGYICQGSIVNKEKQANMFLKFTENIANASSHLRDLGVHGEAMDRKYMERLKDVGLISIVFHIEVWDPKLFVEICPGKAKAMSHEGWLEAFQNAVDLFGAGHVGAVLVGGVTLMPENGHKTWQEARDSMVEGFRWLIKNGVLPTFTHMQLRPGSIYSPDKSNREKLPPTEFYLEASQRHHEAMTQYGLYQKLDKFMKCGLCGDGSYKGEIGMLALAGDTGNWMADVVPYEMNRRAQFVASIRSQSREGQNGVCSTINPR